MIKVFSILTVFILSLSSYDTDAQVYFQYEETNNLLTRRYSIGEVINFRLKDFGEEWIKDDILNLLPEDKSVVFYDQIVQLDQFTHIQYPRPWAHTTGITLMSFGSSWLIMGGTIEGLRSLDALETDYKFGVDTAVIGLSSIATGYLIRKIWGKAIKKLNERKRVRIVDIRF